MSTPTMRRQPRAMLALVALATDLPTPETVTLYQDSGILALTLCSLHDGFAWVRFLGGQPDSFVGKDSGRRHLRYCFLRWHGWTVQVAAAAPAVPDSELDPDAAARLGELAGGAA